MWLGLYIHLRYLISCYEKSYVWSIALVFLEIIPLPLSWV